MACVRVMGSHALNGDLTFVSRQPETFGPKNAPVGTPLVFIPRVRYQALIPRWRSCQRTSQKRFGRTMVPRCRA